MSTSGDERLERLGARLRSIRRERGLTLLEVATAAGLTKGFVSLLERGHKSVSVPTLLALCRALQVEIGALFDYPESEVVRGGLGAPLQMGGDGILEYLLTPAAERNIQVMRTVLAPGGGSGGAYRLACDTIFALVIRGTLELSVGGRVHLLETGDSTTFSGRSPHDWSNPGTSETEVVWVLAPPLPSTPVREGRTGAAD